MSFDPKLFAPEVLARLPHDVKEALIRLTKAAVTHAAFIDKWQGMSCDDDYNAEKGASIGKEVAAASLHFGRTLLKASGGQ